VRIKSVETYGQSRRLPQTSVQRRLAYVRVKWAYLGEKVWIDLQNVDSGKIDVSTLSVRPRTDTPQALMVRSNSIA
jgi:hypothetical protein